MAAYRLAEEAKTHAKEAESVAAAKQYHAAHLSSILDGYLWFSILSRNDVPFEGAAQGAQGRAFAEAAFSAKVSKILHAAEGLQEQTNQQAELIKTAAYAAKSLAGQLNNLIISRSHEDRYMVYRSHINSI